MATKEKEKKGGAEGRRQGGQEAPRAARRAKASSGARTRAPTCPIPAPRLKEFYQATVRAKLSQQFGFTNPHQVPQLEKIVINVGVGEAIKQPKALDSVVEELATITGQAPVRKKAKKSIANFGLRQGQEIGAAVTLRGARMWEFLDRFVSVAIPRIRDFRGLGTQVVRRPWQLFARHQGADDLPGDQLRRNRVDPRDGHHVRDEHESRRSGVRAPEGARHAVPVGRQEGRTRDVGGKRDAEAESVPTFEYTTI